MKIYDALNNLCFALCIDVKQMKETFIYGTPDNIIEWINGKNIADINVFQREIGSFLFDLSSDSMNVSDENVVFCYLRNVIDKANSVDISDDTRKWLSKHLEITQTKIITEDFVEHQRHVSFRSNITVAIDKMIDYSLKRYWQDPSPLMFMKDKYNNDYAITDIDIISTVKYYLRTLYINGLFPRICLNCGRPFIARTYVFDVLCQRDCKKERESDYNRRYKERHNNEYEKLYLKIYRKWYTRLNRSKTATNNTDPSFIQCYEVFSSFISESYDKRTAVSNGDITPDDFKAWIEKKESEMSALWKHIYIPNKRNGK